MSAPYCYDHPRPSVTVDLVAFSTQGEGRRVLLIKRKHDPFVDRWALPGGFLDIDEPIEAGARRELREETGVSAAGPLEFLGVWGDPGRDPRGRTISLVHVVIIPGAAPEPTAGDDADEAAWVDPATVRGMAFDHDDILKAALDWLARRGG
jgi:8-oxo-dGTP diphosphatase